MTSKPPNYTPQYRKVSVVFSFFNEEENLDELCTRTIAALESAEIDFELIFVNDVSTDRSLEILAGWNAKDPRVKVLTTSRNIGVNPCYIAGMHHATGDCCITLDADLQDPPEVMADLIREWKNGADVTYTVRKRREGESPLRMLVTKYAYRIINYISDVPLPVDAGMYRLMDRRVVDQLLVMKENEPYLRGLITWVGFKQVPVEYIRAPRFAGESHFPLFGKAPIAEFLRAILAFSQFPIHVLLFCGLVLTAIAGVLLPVALTMQYTHDLSSSYSITAAIVFFAGTQWIAIGLIGLYVGRIWTQVKDRPRFIIQDQIGFEEDTQE